MAENLYRYAPLRSGFHTNGKAINFQGRGKAHSTEPAGGITEGRGEASGIFLGAFEEFPHRNDLARFHAEEAQHVAFLDFLADIQRPKDGNR